MSRRLLGVCVGLCIAIVAFPGSPARADGAVQIRGVDLRGFPETRVTVSVQGASRLTSSDVWLTENGVATPATTVRPIGSSDRGIDVLLAIDTSNSMRGTPLVTALAAARAFVERVPPWVRIGLMTFADTSRIVVPLTPDHAAVLSALSSPPLTSQWTALYDAVGLASRTFTGGGQRNLILLTDGRNNTGTTALDSAVRAARAARVTVFPIGLDGADTDVPTLQELARLTLGTYALVSPDNLGAAYESLAEQLSQQYVITFRSRAPYGTEAVVRVELPSGSDEIGFLVPGPLAETSAGATSNALSRFLQGPWGLPATVSLSFLAVLSLALLLSGAQARFARERSLAARMSAQPAGPPQVPRRAETNRLTSWIPETVVSAAGQVAEYSGLAGRVDVRLERAGLAMRPGEFLAAAVLAGITGGLIGELVVRNPFIALGLAAIGALVPWLVLQSTGSRRMRRIQAQLPDVLTVLASSLRAGHSFLQALDMVTKEVGDPAGPEFARVVTEIRLGRSVDDALDAMAERTGSEDFGWAVMAIAIQRRVGGNLAEVLETVADTIRERETVRRQIRVLSAEGRLSVVILTVLPFLIAAYIFVVNPTYIDTLFRTTIGIALVVGASVLMVVGYVWMRRIVDVDI